MFNKDAVMDIPCPGCQHLKKLTISEIESNPVFVCEGCNKEITLDGTEFTQGLADAEKKMKDLFKGFSLN